MSQPLKFPDMRATHRRAPTPLPTPSGYRRTAPPFPTSDGTPQNRRVERRRLILWFGVAVALHAALLLGLWLTPPLRLKWAPAADAWVQVISLPRKQPDALAEGPKESKPPARARNGTPRSTP
ncbi:MAG: hypothetical protein M3N97_00365 [Pseudomonadota bacterium]|nr:hypothetical protein [Pseudomonadota bacterium]